MKQCVKIIVLQKNIPIYKIGEMEFSDIHPNR